MSTDKLSLSLINLVFLDKLSFSDKLCLSVDKLSLSEKNRVYLREIEFIWFLHKGLAIYARCMK